VKVRTLRIHGTLSRRAIGAWTDEYEIVVPELAGPVDLEQLLRGHPEDQSEDPTGPAAQMAEYLRRVVPMFSPPGRLELVPAGTRWHDGCVAFDTVDGRTIVMPLDRITHLECGPVREAPPA